MPSAQNLRSRCAHESCGCPPGLDHEPYCGPYCANVQLQSSLPGEAELPGACACGHEACRICDDGGDPGEGRTAIGRR